MKLKLAPITWSVLAAMAASSAFGQAVDSAQAAPAPSQTVIKRTGAPPSQVPDSGAASQVPGQGPGGPGGPRRMFRGGPPPQAAPAKPAKPPWTEFTLNPKTTLFLDFTESSPDMVISILSRTSGITIVKDPSFKTPMTVTSAKAVSLNDAFEIFNTVLDLNGYELEKKGKLLVVAKKPPPAPPPPQIMPPQPPPPNEDPVIKVYPIVHGNASQLARIVNEVFSQQQLEQLMQQLQNGGGGNPMQMQMQLQQRGVGAQQQPKIIRASSDDYSNSVVVNAPQKLQVQVEALLKQLDQNTEQPLEQEVFKLKFVSVDEVETAVQDVLTANAPTGRGGSKPQDNQNQGYFYYNPFGNQNTKKSGAQSAIAVKETNSLIVSATKENMVVVRKLIENLDQKSDFVGTTSVIHLQNAKAADMATLLNTAFTQRKDVNQSDNPFLVFFGDGSDQSNKKKQDTDIDETGHVVNVRDLTGKVNIVADPNTNSLIVVTLPSNLKLIQKIVDSIDKVSDQVMIETVIVEANLDKTTKLGIEWSFLQNKVLNSSTTSATGGTTYGLQGTTPPLQGFSYTLTGNDYKIFLNALETDTRFKVLDTPRIFTSNNMKSEINVSQRVPYIKSQQSGVIGNLISNYDFLDVGVVLTVTPRITASGQVTMDVVQSADDLQGFTTFNAPIVNHREATTTVSVNDGDTIILGGIIRQTKNKTINKIPILGDIPLFGRLFQSSSDEVGQTELMVLMTPHIVRTPEEAIRLREEQIKRMSKESQGELKRIIPPQ